MSTMHYQQTCESFTINCLLNKLQAKGTAKGKTVRLEVSSDTAINYNKDIRLAASAGNLQTCTSVLYHPSKGWEGEAKKHPIKFWRNHRSSFDIVA